MGRFLFQIGEDIQRRLEEFRAESKSKLDEGRVGGLWEQGRRVEIAREREQRTVREPQDSKSSKTSRGKGKASCYIENQWYQGGGNLGRQEGPGCWCGGFEMYTRYLWIGTEGPGGQYGCWHAATGACQWSHMSLLPGGRKRALWRTENPFYKFLRNAGFYQITRNPPIVRCELISGYLYFLKEQKHTQKNLQLFT